MFNWFAKRKRVSAPPTVHAGGGVIAPDPVTIRPPISLPRVEDNIRAAGGVITPGAVTIGPHRFALDVDEGCACFAGTAETGWLRIGFADPGYVKAGIPGLFTAQDVFWSPHGTFIQAHTPECIGLGPRRYINHATIVDEGAFRLFFYGENPISPLQPVTAIFAELPALFATPEQREDGPRWWPAEETMSRDLRRAGAVVDDRAIVLGALTIALLPGEMPVAFMHHAGAGWISLGRETSPGSRRHDMTRDVVFQKGELAIFDQLAGCHHAVFAGRMATDGRFDLTWRHRDGICTTGLYRFADVRAFAAGEPFPGKNSDP